MPNLAQHAALANDDGFRRRLQAAVVQKATPFATATKPTDATKVQAWQEQRALAASLLADAFAAMQRYAWPVAADNAVLNAFTNGDQTQVPDAAIESALVKALQAELDARRIDAAAAP